MDKPNQRILDLHTNLFYKLFVTKFTKKTLIVDTTWVAALICELSRCIYWHFLIFIDMSIFSFRRTAFVWLVVLTLCSGYHSLAQRQECMPLSPQKAAAFEDWMQQKAKQARPLRTSETLPILRLPVVVHVLHLGEAEGEGFNIPKEQIVRQIQILNEDFRRIPGTRGYNTHPVGVDTRIEFQLAQYTPSGDPTDGIVRIDINSVTEDCPNCDLLENIAYYKYWDPERYINVWVYPGFRPNTLLGQAQYPETDLPGPVIKSEKGDGILISTPHFGETTLESDANLGRTLTHEMGHFLGLLHMWGVKWSCDNDDFCQDTPPVSGATDCNTHPVACDGTSAMVGNYMDYSGDACMNIFTNDQLFRMRTVLENSPRRKTLTSSTAIDRKIPVVRDAMVVYPNPTLSNEVVVAFPSNNIPETFELVALSVTGKEIYRANYTSNTEAEVTIKLPKSLENILILHIIAAGITYQTQKLVHIPN